MLNRRRFLVMGGVLAAVAACDPVSISRRLLLALAGSGSFVGGPMLNLINVKSRGALGNDSADDTTALNSAIAERNAKPGSMLYFPTGAYRITSDLDPVTTPGLIFGDNGTTGQAADPGRTSGLSLIQYDTATGTALTIEATDVMLSNLVIRNKSGTAPTAGAGVLCSYATVASSPMGRVDFDNVALDGFYDDIDQQGGTFWTAFRCQIMNAVRYGFRIRNVSNPDWGMWSINNCFFLNYDQAFTTEAAIRLESSGGGKITASNFVASAGLCDRYLDIVGGAGTSSLVMANCQMEAFAIEAVRSVGSFPFQVYSNLEMAQYAPNTAGSAFNLSDNTDVIINQVAFNTNVTGPAPAKAVVSSGMTRLIVGDECTNNGYTSIT